MTPLISRGAILLLMPVLSVGACARHAPEPATVETPAPRPAEIVVEKPLVSRSAPRPMTFTVQGPLMDELEDPASGALLDKRLPNVRFNGDPFADCIEALEDVAGCEIRANWDALEAAGLDRTTPVTARLRDVRFERALDTILTDVAGTRAPVGYTVKNAVVTISTRLDLPSGVVTRTYNVRDILPDLPRLTGAAPDDMRTEEEKAPELMQFIQDVVAPDSWQEAGGSIGTMDGRSDELVVVQTPRNHQLLENLLRQIRKAQEGRRLGR